MIDDELGAANMPPPIPLRAVSSAKAQYGKSTGSIMRPMKLAPNTTMPAVAKPRAPKRSDRKPDTGPEMRMPAVSGSRKIPAQKGVSL
jgi:hypothetical protein